MDGQKQPFLVCYDYGMGGLWGVMMARTEQEIVRLYPELHIAHERPEWMSDEHRGGLPVHDIDAAPRGLLDVVLDDRD